MFVAGTGSCGVQATETYFDNNETFLKEKCVFFNIKGVHVLYTFNKCFRVILSPNNRLSLFFLNLIGQLLH